MHKKFITLLLTICLLIFNSNLLYADSSQFYIMKTIDDMSLDEKIGQLFIVRVEMIDPLYISDVKSGKKIIHTSITDEMKKMYDEYPCGGFVLFSRNIENEEQLKNLTSSLHKLNTITPFITIDEEGGSVSRIANNENFDVERFESNEKIAEKGNIEDAYNLGYTIGSYLKKYGIDVDFAPVADINTNPNNKIIGKRAFGSDPDIASKMVSECIKGFHDVGIATCVKHFPGHGDTSSDSHLGKVYTYKTWDELKEAEIIPFESSINDKTEMIMVGHISTPNITGNDDPATLSSELLTNKLRKELNYKGIIISDSFEMGAIVEYYDAKEAIVKAINAGVDIILLPENYKESFKALKEAVLDGEVSEQRIEESLIRILSLKNKMFSLFNKTNENISSHNMLVFPNKKLLELFKTK